MTTGFKISETTALAQLQETYGLEDWRAQKVLEIARQFGRKAEPCAGGYVLVIDRGLSSSGRRLFNLVNHAEAVAPRSEVRYTSSKPVNIIKKKEKVMPPRRAAKPAPAPEPEPEVEEAEEQEVEIDYRSYVDKPLTATMQEYFEWAEEQIGPLDELPTDVLWTLGARFYNWFQKSPEHRAKREARRQERLATRAAGNGADEEETEEEAPAPARPSRKAGRPARKPAPVAEAEPEEEEAPAKPAPRRGRKPAATATAPY
jgi:hypothetical protein